MMCCGCKTITGLLILLAGLVLALGLGMMGATPAQISGGLLLLAGLSFVVHGMKMCPSCKECCETKKK